MALVQAGASLWPSLALALPFKEIIEKQVSSNKIYGLGLEMRFINKSEIEFPQI